MIQRKKLGEIANISAGQGAPQGAENYSEEGTPFVKAGDLFDLVNGKCECDIQKVSDEVAKNHRLKLYPKGTVLFAKSGMSCMKGYVYATNAECYVVSHLACIMPFDVDSKYLKYYFEYHRPNQLVKDASYPSISLADIAEMPINVFDAQTQAKIVDNLDAVNSLIGKSKEELDLLDNIVKSRFVEMFGNRKNSNCNAKALGEFCKFQQGTQVPVEDQIEESLDGYRRFLRIIDYTQAPQPPRYVSVKGKEIEEDSVVIVRYGATAGFVGHGYAGILANNLFEIIPDEAVLSKEFLYLALKHGTFEQEIHDKAFGAAMPALSFGMMNDIVVVTPSFDEQQCFMKFVEQVNKSKLAVKQSLEKLETLKKSLMQQYFG